MEPLQKSVWIFLPAPWLVIVQHYGMFRVSAGTVQPHIALGLWRPAFFVKHLYLGLVRVKQVMLPNHMAA